MAEQLSFRLEPALTRPANVAPMWPTPAAEPFDSDTHLFEPTWGGQRVLVFIDPSPDGLPGRGTVRLLDADGRDLAPVLPELAGLAVRVGASSAVLDGELVVADARGRPDVEGMAARFAGRPARPVALLVYDVLHVDGRWLLAVPLTRRRRELRRILRPGDEVVAVPAITGEGRALFDAVAAQGIPGMLAREAESPYLPGVTSRLWRSVAVRPGDGTAAGHSAAADPGAEPIASDGAVHGASVGTGPVLALFRRLPFPDEPAG